MRKHGDEYWGDWVRDISGTESTETRIKYRVVEIVKVHEFGTYGKLVDTERIEAIAVEKRPYIINYLTPLNDSGQRGL